MQVAGQGLQDRVYRAADSALQSLQDSIAQSGKHNNGSQWPQENNVQYCSFDLNFEYLNFRHSIHVAMQRGMKRQY